MENEKIEEKIKDLSPLIEILRLKNEALNKYEEQVYAELHLMDKNITAILDTIIDISKTVFTVSFTGYIALNVVNPDLINATKNIKALTLSLLFSALIMMLFSARKKGQLIKKTLNSSKSRSESLFKLSEFEQKNLQFLFDLHSNKLNQK